MAVRKGLGRGLDALFADAVPVNNPESEEKETKAKSSKKKAAAEETAECRREKTENKAVDRDGSDYRIGPWQADNGR